MVSGRTIKAAAAGMAAAIAGTTGGRMTGTVEKGGRVTVTARADLAVTVIVTAGARREAIGGIPAGMGLREATDRSEVRDRLEVTGSCVRGK